MALPHLQNSTAGRNKFDPVHANIFEVRFTLPEAIRAAFGKDELIISCATHSIFLSSYSCLFRHLTSLLNPDLSL